MSDLSGILARWWKRIAVLAVVAVALSVGILALQPKQYLSVATALPANSATLDKARIFNPNIQHLYPEIGSPDELDRFLGITELETLYRELAVENNLPAHYNIKGENPIYKAAEELRSSITVSRSKWNDLKIRAWDKDPQMAARLANAFLAKAEAVHQKLQLQNNRLILQQIQQDLAIKEKQLQGLYTASSSNDSTASLKTLRLKALEQQVTQLQQLADQYNLVLQTPLPLLLIAEKATPSIKPDRPKMAQTAAFVLFAALGFGLLVAIFIESQGRHAA